MKERQLHLSSEGREEVKETKLKNGEAGRRRTGGEARGSREVMGKGQERGRRRGRAKLSACSHRGRGGSVVGTPSALGSCGEKGEELRSGVSSAARSASPRIGKARVNGVDNINVL